MNINRLSNASRMELAAQRGEYLARFLNAPVDDLQHHRVIDVFGLIQRLKSLEPSSRIAGNVRRLINAHLSELRVVPVLRQNGDWDWMPGHPNKPARGPVTGTEEPEVTPIFALKLVSDMASNGIIERMRQCEACGKWFFARTNKKLVCGNACRFEKYKRKDKDAFDKHRANYMKEYYKHPTVKAKRIKAKRRKNEPTK